MFEYASTPDQPFWVDDQNPYAPLPPAKRNLLTRVAGVGYSLSSLMRFVSLILFVALALKFPWLWILVIFEGVILIARVYLPRKVQNRQVQAAQIQQRAKDKTGADHIGSALHTAGHPLLQANQPVVLALKDSALSIYSYVSSTPIDTIAIGDLQSIETVVYDDDHIPHSAVVDNTAQALQLTFSWRNQTCTCLFRRMYKVRPIDWYQAIQTARLINGAG